jgi:hypothetical protein
MAVADVKFEATGRAWRFKFGFDALCRLEEEYDLPFQHVISRVMPELAVADLEDPDGIAAAVTAAASNIRMSDVRAILMAGVGEDITRQQAADIVDELGVDTVFDIFRKSIAGGVAGGEGGPRKGKSKARRPSGSTAKS